MILILLVAAVMLAGLEVAGRVEQPDTNFTDRSSLTSESDLLLELYPDSPEADYIRGMQARYLRLDLHEAREHFERAIATGVKSHPRLLYDYAATLHLMQAPAEEVAAAKARWLENDPASGLPSPDSLHLPFPEWNKPGSVKVMALCDNGRHFALAKDGAITWINLFSQDERGEIVSPDSHTFDHLLEFSADGSLLLAADADGTVAILNVEDNAIVHLLNGHRRTVTSGRFTYDGQACATGSSDGEVRLWSVEDGRCTMAEALHDYPVSALALDRRGRRLLSGDRHGVIRMTSVRGDKPDSQILADGRSTVAGLAFSPDQRRAAVAFRDHHVRIIDLQNGEFMQHLPGHTAPVASVAFAPLGRMLASGGADRTVRIWDIDSGEEITVRPVSGEDGVCTVTFTEFGDAVIAADFNGSVHPIPVPQR